MGQHRHMTRYFRPDSSIPMPALLKRFALLYLPIVIVLSITLLSLMRLDEQGRLAEIEESESMRIAVAEALIAQNFSVLSAELRLISSLPGPRRYLDSGDSVQREELEDFFLVLSHGGQYYDQMRYLDASGQEVIRISHNGGKPVIVPREQLQDKSERDYFRDTVNLKQGEIFVSALDLNIEQGRVETPYKPMIRFGTPVFDSAGRKKGVIVLNYYGNTLLRQFREAMQGKDRYRSMLLNSDGYWLSSENREDEWGFMLGKDERTFGHDFPEEWRVISATEQGSLLTERGLFVYATSYPLLSGHHSFAASDMAHAHSQQEAQEHRYYWKIVSFVPRAVLAETAFYRQIGSKILLFFVYLLLALGAWITALATLGSKQAENAFHLIGQKHRLLFESSRDALMIVAPPSWNFTDANQAALQLFGASGLAEFTAHGPSDVLPERQPDGSLSSEKVQEFIAITMREGSHSFECEHQRLDGRPFAADVLLTRMAVGNDTFIQATVRDISERKQLEEELRHQARIDLLTGINNRRHFFELAEQERVRAKRYGVPLPVLMLDVDHFKLVNDTYGHLVGDTVLQKLSEVCTHTLREIDIFGRLGGEEFAILLPETKMERALEVAERLRLAVADATVPIEQGGSVHFTISIGVAMFVATDAKVGDILHRADLALYAAKNGGRNRVCREEAG
ncbi:MAG: diguanylate cyclase [Gammaproteobacteria bacterium]|nr:diguanylate cyclase [Gammaproteobacteria bacterium]